MKRIEPDNHLSVPPSCIQEQHEGDEIVPSNVPASANTAESAGNVNSEGQLGFDMPSQIGPAGSTVTGEIESHGLVRPQDSVTPATLDQEGELETSSLSVVLRLLRRLQDEANMNHRFHLFVESVENVTDETASPGSSVMCPIFTRCPFSPTLHPSNQEQKTLLAHVCQKITEFSFGKVPHIKSQPPSRFASSPAGETIGTPRLSIPVTTINEQQSTDTNITSFHASWPLRVYENLSFPSWCPFKAKEYTTPPQASEDHLFIKKSVLERFIKLEDFQVVWIYQELFKFLYRVGRKKRLSGMARTLTYSQFTPPWIRRLIAVEPDNPNGENGDSIAETITLKKVAIMHLRNERNTQGYRRVRFLLTAFFCHEPDTIKPLIQHLFHAVPSVRAVTRRKASKKRIILSENLPDDRNAQSNKRVRSRLERSRPAPPMALEDGSSRARKDREGHNNSAETPEIQQNPQTLITVSPRSATNVTSDARRTPRDTNMPSSPRSTTRASSENDRASTPTPTRLLSFTKKVLSPREEQITKQTRRKSVFADILDTRASHKQSSQSEANQSNQITHPVDSSGPPNPNSEEQVPSEVPLTPFSPTVESLQHTEGQASSIQEAEVRASKEVDDNPSMSHFGEDEEDLTNPRDGPIKCGALARCIYFLNHFMQCDKQLDGQCKLCKYQMHKRCVALHAVCDECIKKTVFKSIYKADISKA